MFLSLRDLIMHSWFPKQEYCQTFILRHLKFNNDFVTVKSVRRDWQKVIILISPLWRHHASTSTKQRVLIISVLFSQWMITQLSKQNLGKSPMNIKYIYIIEAVHTINLIQFFKFNILAVRCMLKHEEGSYFSSL